MTRHLIALLIGLCTTAANAQTPTPLVVEQPVSWTDLAPGTPRTVPLNVDQKKYWDAVQERQPIVVNIKIDGVPADKVADLRMSNSQKAENSPANPLIFKSTGWKTGRSLTLTFGPLGSKRTERSSLQILEPAPLEEDAYVLDFCPTTAKPLQLPHKHTWAYLKPGEQARMIIRNINPLRYSVRVDATALAFNTDAAAVRGTIDAFLKNAFVAAGSQPAGSTSTEQELLNLLDVPYALSAKLTELRKLKCITATDLTSLSEFLAKQEQNLNGYNTEARLEIQLKTLAGILESDTAATIVKKKVAASADNKKSGEATTPAEKGKPAKTSTDKTEGQHKPTVAQEAAKPDSVEKDVAIPVPPAVKASRAALAAYAKKDGLAKATMTLFDQLKGVADAVTLETDVVNVDDYPGADVIRFTKTTKNILDSTAPVTTRQYDMWVVGRVKFDYSAGPVVTWLADQTQTVFDEIVTQKQVVEGADKVPVQKDVVVVRQRVVPESGDRATLALATLGHAYIRTTCGKGGFNIGLTVGGGITTKARPILLAGASVLLGRQQRFVVNAGVAVGTQKERSIRFDDPANYYITAPAETITYVDRTKTRLFLGLTFNFGKNEKVVSVVDAPTEKKE